MRVMTYLFLVLLVASVISSCDSRNDVNKCMDNLYSNTRCSNLESCLKFLDKMEEICSSAYRPKYDSCVRSAYHSLHDSGDNDDVRKEKLKVSERICLDYKKKTPRNCPDFKCELNQ